MNYLFIALLLCHWLADYTHLSRPYMLAAKRLGKPLVPIIEHATVHAALMLVVAWVASDLVTAAKVYLLQLVTHFLIDVWKGRMNVWFPQLQSPANVYHWYVFGLDQMLHLLVILWIVNIVI